MLSTQLHPGAAPRVPPPLPPGNSSTSGALETPSVSSLAPAGVSSFHWRGGGRRLRFLHCGLRTRAPAGPRRPRLPGSLRQGPAARPPAKARSSRSVAPSNPPPPGGPGDSPSLRPRRWRSGGGLARHWRAAGGGGAGRPRLPPRGGAGRPYCRAVCGGGGASPLRRLRTRTAASPFAHCQPRRPRRAAPQPVGGGQGRSHSFSG